MIRPLLFCLLVGSSVSALDQDSAPVLRQNSSRAQNQQLTAVSPTDDLV